MPCGDSHRQESQPTNCSERDSSPIGITNVRIPRASGGISPKPISFTLVVDDFGVKYVGKEHVHHLIKCLRDKYEFIKDWTGNLYCGINYAGTTPLASLTYQCRDTSRSSCTNTSIKWQRNRNIVRTPLHQNNTELTHKPHSQTIPPPNYPPTK